MPTVQIGGDAITGAPGDTFTVILKLATEGASHAFVVSFPVPAGISEMKFAYGLPTGATSLLSPSSERVGAIVDTITLPANKTATIAITAKSSRLISLGTTISFAPTVGGVTYTQPVYVLGDNFQGQRGTLNINEALSVLGGTADRSLPARLKSGINSIQDHANRGLRWWHLFDDLMERRGLPTETDLTGGLVHAPSSSSLAWEDLTVGGDGMVTDTVVPLAAAKSALGTVLRGRIILPVGMVQTNGTVFATLPLPLRPTRPTLLSVATSIANGTTTPPIPYEPNTPTWGSNFEMIHVATDGTMKRKNANGAPLTSIMSVYFDGQLIPA